MSPLLPRNCIRYLSQFIPPESFMLLLAIMNTRRDSRPACSSFSRLTEPIYFGSSLNITFRLPCIVSTRPDGPTSTKAFWKCGQFRAIQMKPSRVRLRSMSRKSGGTWCIVAWLECPSAIRHKPDKLAGMNLHFSYPWFLLGFRLGCSHVGASWE